MQKMPNPNPPKIQTLAERIQEQIEAEKAREPIRRAEELRRKTNRAAGLAMQILQMKITEWTELDGGAIATVQDGMAFIFDENINPNGFVVYYNKDKRVKLLKEDGTLGDGKLMGQIESFNDLCIMMKDVM